MNESIVSVIDSLKKRFNNNLSEFENDNKLKLLISTKKEESYPIFEISLLNEMC